MMYNKIIIGASAIAGCIAVQVEGKDKDNKVAKKFVVPAVALLGCAGTAQAMDFTEDLKSFETFNAPDIVKNAVWTEKNTVYPESLNMKVPFQGEELELKLSADRELFADDWSIVDGSTGEVITDDKESQMCHYVGQVKGKPGSYVNLSVCNDAGMTGFIHTNDFDAEIRPMDTDAKSMGQSVIYSMNDLILPADIKFEHAVAGFEEFAANANMTRQAGAMPAYVMNLVTASDSARMNAQSSESSNTQSIVSQMNSRYTNSNWGSGNSLRITLQTQVQNANMGGSPTSNLSSYLPRVASWKGSNYPNSDNVQGLTSFNQGGTIGVAYLTTMCSRSNSAGINNVGFTSSTASRGILVAHEAGHNFAMQHDNNNNPSVMSSSINSNAQSFSNPSVNDFLRSSPKSCL
jgi:hypothetical protein